MTPTVTGAATQVGGVREPFLGPEAGRTAGASGQDRRSGEPGKGEPMRKNGGVRGPFLGPEAGRTAGASGQDRRSGEPGKGEPMRKNGGVRGPCRGPRIQ
jgi:hypothetical protein